MKHQPNHHQFFGAILAVFLTLACVVPSHADQNTPYFITVGLKYEIRMVRPPAKGGSEVVTVLEASNQWIKVRDVNGKVFWLNTSQAITIAEAQ